MSDCLFCRIVRKEIPAVFVAEDEHCIAFRDIKAQAPVHVLVVPKAKRESLRQRPTNSSRSSPPRFEPR